MLPEGWTKTKFGTVFKNSRAKGMPGLPLMSVSQSDGLVLRQSIDRKMDTNLTAEEHLFVKQNDIAYNMMRMWQGAFGLAKFDGLVSPSYVVLSAKENVDPLFASYLFAMQRTLHHFWSYSYGITDDRLRLYFKDFGSIPVDLPSLGEQKKIAEILSTWDRAIAVQERLIANARAQKKALVQRMLSPKTHLGEPSNHWNKVTLRDAATIWYGTSPNGIALDDGNIPVIGTGGVVGRTNQKTDAGPAIIIGRKGTIDKPQLITGPFWAIDTTYFCKPNVNYDLVWLYYNVQTLNFKALNEASGVPSLSRETLYSVQLSAPDHSEQKRIGQIIQQADSFILKQILQLDELRQEKSALMQQLLTGKRRVKIDEKLA
jgi:type I restriction enzyme S subunit